MGRRDVGLATRQEPKAHQHRAWTSLADRLRAPTDASMLAYFRIGFGLIVSWEVFRYADHGWITAYYVNPEFLFTWPLFDWVKPWPAAGMHVHFAVLGFAGLFLALGFLYRISAAVVFLGISYVFLLDKARFLNHIYLVILFAFLLIFLPAHRAFSIDASTDPSGRARTVPAWTVWLLRFQVGVPYFFGGIAKLNADWLVRAEPLRTWLGEETDFPIFGALFVHEPVVRAMAYSSVLIDLCVPFLLLRRSTRVPAFTAALAFHLMNSRLFGIGVFPWTMIIATAVFFPADWPRRVWSDLRRLRADGTWAVAIGFIVGFWLGGWLPGSFSLVKALVGAAGVAILSWHAVRDWLGPPLPENRAQAKADRRPARARASAEVALEAPPRWRRVGSALVALWVFIQIAVPLRHFAIPGNVSWTEEGHRFSWHMKLRSKDGVAVFWVSEGPRSRERPIDPDDYLTDRQVSVMSGRPDMLVDFAHYLERRLRPSEGTDLVVRADVRASLSERPWQRLIDPTVDLTKVGRPSLPPARWIRPLRPIR